ncbi:DUF5956 family protein [Streptomyces sp. SBC-4]|nr:DUF5956 family protein [Streptomyces sp. SBC-4]MDV5142896.1 DUF5956 family protein [Streptomyces sp. SBC-4]
MATGMTASPTIWDHHSKPSRRPTLVVETVVTSFTLPLRARNGVPGRAVRSGYCLHMSWDVSGIPHRVASRRSGTSELEPDRLPEVRELAEMGWALAPEAPMWVFLPYVWPAEDRTWVPDRSTRWQIDTTLDAADRLLDVVCHPLSPAEKDTQEEDAAADLALVGVPPRPPGRLWLLRPVGDLENLEVVLEHLCAAAEARGVNTGLSVAFTDLCAGELKALAVCRTPALNNCRYPKAMNSPSWSSWYLPLPVSRCSL